MVKWIPAARPPRNDKGQITAMLMLLYRMIGTLPGLKNRGNA
jgi:hypothetical protein